MWYHVNNNQSTPWLGKRAKDAGVKAGVFDLFFFYNGQAYWVELKTEKGRLSKPQREFGKLVDNNKGRWEIARSLDEFKETVTSWGLPLKAREVAQGDSIPF